MNWLEELRVGLEASVMTQMALFASFVVARADWRKPTGFFLGAICGSVALALLLNVTARAGFVPALRTLNYFVDLSLGPLLLGLAARAGMPERPLRRADAIHLIGPVCGAIALAAPWAPGPDIVAALSIWSYLAAALITIWRRRKALWQARCFTLVGAVACVMAVTAIMRVLMALSAESGQSYRDSVGYLAVLFVAFAMALQLLWLALRHPKLYAATSLQTEDELSELAQAFSRLVDGSQLFLQPQLELADVATRVRAPPRSVSRMLATRFGENFSAYLNRRRAEHAAALLTEGDLPVTTIMYDAGFGSKSAFQREFVKRHGVNPSEYRRRHASNSTSQYR